MNAPNAAAINEHFNKEDKAGIIVIPELKDFLDILSPDERKGLEADLIADGGAREPLLIWKEQKAIVDGHNRYEICKAHGLKFTTVEKSFKDIEEVKQWMLRNQLNRRNLDPLRISYFRGKLYNEMKQDPTKARKDAGGVTTAEKLADNFGVGEKTIRRDGNVAAGIDAVGRVHRAASIRQKLEIVKDKNSGFKKEELEEIGKVADPKVQEEAVKELTKIKEETKVKADAVREKVKAAQQAAKPQKQEAAKKEKTEPYGVVFCKPNFDSLTYSAAAEVKPPMSDNAACYMAVPDEAVGKAMALFSRWGLNYDGSIVFTISDPYEGLFADVQHTFLMIGTKGTVAIKGKVVKSIVGKSDDVDAAMIATIEAYHKGARKIDMRKSQTAKGWDKL